MRRIGLPTVALALLLIAVAPTVVRSNELPASLHTCMAERDDARRLACFDRAAADFLRQPADAAEPPPPLTAEERFGLKGKLAARRDAKSPPELKELKAKAVGVSTLPRGEFVVTLDSGQVWIEEPPSHHLELAPGDSVTLIPGVLGSYFLVVPNGRSARAKRVR